MVETAAGTPALLEEDGHYGFLSLARHLAGGEISGFPQRVACITQLTDRHDPGRRRRRPPSRSSMTWLVVVGTAVP